MIEILISFVALLLILFFGHRGWRQGFFRSTSHLLVVIFAILWGLRWWHPYTGWLAERLGISADQLAFVAFWCVFAVVFIPLNALAGALSDEFVPVYPVGIERLGDFLGGAMAAALLCSAVLLSALPWLPNIYPAYDSSRLLLPMDRLPLAVFRGVEEMATGLPPDDSARTLLPFLEGKPGETFQVGWR